MLLIGHSCFTFSTVTYTLHPVKVTTTFSTDSFHPASILPLSVSALHSTVVPASGTLRVLMPSLLVKPFLMTSFPFFSTNCCCVVGSVTADAAEAAIAHRANTAMRQTRVFLKMLLMFVAPSSCGVIAGAAGPSPDRPIDRRSLLAD